MKLVINMLNISEDAVIEKKLFEGIAAFAERLLYPMFAWVLNLVSTLSGL